MKLKLLALLLAVICIGMVISGCGDGNQQAVTEEPSDPANGGEGIDPIKINFADPSTTGSFINEQTLYFAEKVSEISGGKMVIDVFSDAILGTETTMLTNIQSGGLEMGGFVSTFATMVPKAGLFDLPYLISDRSKIQDLIDGGIMKEIYDQAEEVNIKVIGFGENGFRHITNNIRPIVVPEDLNGVVIRTPGNELRVKTFETLGASAVSMSWSEVYSGLETGVIDGQENPFSQIGGGQLYNVQKYLSLSGHIYGPFYIGMNLDLYNTLTDAQKDVLEEAAIETLHYGLEKGAEFDVEQLQLCEDNGMEINEVNDEEFRNKLLPLWDEFADVAGGAEFVNKAKAVLGY